MSRENKNCLNELKTMLDKVDWEVEDDRREFLRQLYPLINDWNGQLPDLRDMFRPEAIDWLLTESSKDACENDDDDEDDDEDDDDETNPIIDFVINTGYKDVPKVDENGKLSVCRTTPIHYVSRSKRSGKRHIIRDLFIIFDQFDVNYIDEDGSTHFHIACKYGFADIVEKFLELGQDPNCREPIKGDSPLHLALDYLHKEVAELLLRNGANVNLANEYGQTPLHIMAIICFDEDMAKILFEISNDKRQTVQVDSRDDEGNTPLHFAMGYGFEDTKVIEYLLKTGADPNSTNEEGETPLHLFMVKDPLLDANVDLLKIFFNINDELNQAVQVNARNKLDQTPLQLAVENLLPDAVDVLLDRGADLSSFVFLNENYFAESCIDAEEISLEFKLEVASGAMAVVERLEKRGYQLSRSDVLIIMKLFAKHELFEMSTDLDEYWYDAEEFVRNAKEIMISPNLSLHNLIKLRPVEAAKLLTYQHYVQLRSSKKLWELPKSYHKEVCVRHLCEKLSRGFFLRWALEPIMELTRYRLPILCCEIIIDKLKNQDLCNICLAAAGHKLR